MEMNITVMEGRTTAARQEGKDVKELFVIRDKGTRLIIGAHMGDGTIIHLYNGTIGGLSDGIAALTVHMDTKGNGPAFIHVNAKRKES